MTTPDYWRRVVGHFLVHQQGELTIRFVDREGQRRRWTGSWVRPDMVGLLIEREGQWVRLCAWNELCAVENAGRKVAT